MPVYVFVPLEAGKGAHGQGLEDWDNAFTHNYADNCNAFRFGLLKASAGQYAVYNATANGNWAAYNGAPQYVGVAYSRKG